MDQATARLLESPAFSGVDQRWKDYLLNHHDLKYVHIQVIGLLLQGRHRPNKIADDLAITPSTAQQYIDTICRTLKVKAKTIQSTLENPDNFPPAADTDSAWSALSKREIEALSAFLAGYPITEIAKRSKGQDGTPRSIKTITTHLERVREKLGANSPDDLLLSMYGELTEEQLELYRKQLRPASFRVFVELMNGGVLQKVIGSKIGRTTKAVTSQFTRIKRELGVDNLAELFAQVHLHPNKPKAKEPIYLWDQLSPREKETLSAFLAGYTPTEIAQKSNEQEGKPLSIKTIVNYLERVRKKIGANSSNDLLLSMYGELTEEQLELYRKQLRPASFRVFVELMNGGVLQKVIGSKIGRTTKAVTSQFTRIKRELGVDNLAELFAQVHLYPNKPKAKEPIYLWDQLSPREKETLSAFLAGYTPTEIAQRFKGSDKQQLSKKTASTYLKRICNSLGATSQADLLKIIYGDLPDELIEKFRPKVSDEEFIVLKHLTTGTSRKEIASKLDISEKTLSTHVTRIKAKLGVTNLAELFALVHLGDPPKHGSAPTEEVAGPHPEFTLC